MRSTAGGQVFDGILQIIFRSHVIEKLLGVDTESVDKQFVRAFQPGRQAFQQLQCQANPIPLHALAHVDEDAERDRDVSLETDLGNPLQLLFLEYFEVGGLEVFDRFPIPVSYRHGERYRQGPVPGTSRRFEESVGEQQKAAQENSLDRKPDPTSVSGMIPDPVGFRIFRHSSLVASVFSCG